MVYMRRRNPPLFISCVSFRNTFIIVDGGIVLEPEQLMVSMFE